MTSLALHQSTRSGNCYKIPLTASLVGIKIAKIIQYDTLKGETRTEHYLSNINSNGKVPVLQIGAETFIAESNDSNVLSRQQKPSGPYRPAASRANAAVDVLRTVLS
ncbi:hypothetical protein CERZMDRAFT_99192 [Cercospora zeae-maydis SCOH1-5]|uniref:GST N-terminal domain-containing protein n=1 Tax=Cercospora zeae-maydis SCOH1-5 TaxID=717836 RepID=A0A6A6FB11_9PEZI|nr:hypothetical protein CERZMDRAFT_99192 [Cercospora zeae-maydis SCOH1-5]